MAWLAGPAGIGRDVGQGSRVLAQGTGQALGQGAGRASSPHTAIGRGAGRALAQGTGQALGQGAGRASSPHTAIGPAIGRHAAQQLARRELSKAIYHRGSPLTRRILGAIGRWLNRFFAGANGVLPGGWWALIALAALAVIAVAAVAAWIGPVSSRRRAAGGLLAGKAVTAGELRDRAERLAMAGDYSGAVIESVRAIATELGERGVLPPRAGRTADELAAETARVLPAEAAELATAARLFDEVRYGDRAGTLAGYQQVRGLGARIHATPAAVGALRPAAMAAAAGAVAGPP
jgi:hypothetical protein